MYSTIIIAASQEENTPKNETKGEHDTTIFKHCCYYSCFFSGIKHAKKQDQEADERDTQHTVCE